MKKAILVSILICMSIIPVSYGQTGDFFVGPSISFHNEFRSKMIYGSGREERNSFTQFFGTGIRMQKRFRPTWELNIGINYVKRFYEMIVPYDHCQFLKEGEGCTYILAHVDRYGYKTIEIPLGINKYLLTKGRWEMYGNLNAVTAYDIQSFYNPYIPESEIKKINEFNFFSGSLTGSMGVGYNLTDQLRLNIEPFVRLIHTQRIDPILITGYEEAWTYFDNFGVHILLMLRMGNRYSCFPNR